MSFPVYIGLDTFEESQFSGLGYTGAFLALIEALGRHCIRTPYSASDTSLTLGTGIMSITVDVNCSFQIGDHVRAFNSLTTFMEGMVVSFDMTSGEAEPFENLVVDFTKFTGTGTYSSWTIVPTGITECPMPMSRGGSPATTLADLPKSLGMRNKQNVVVCESNFFSKLSTTNPYPFYKEVLTGGSVDSDGNVGAGIYGSSPGIALLTVPAPGGKAFLSYGDRGFLYLGDGGDLQFQCRGFAPTTAGVIIRLGLMVDVDNNLSDQFQSFGFGFEIYSQDGSYQVIAVVNDGTNIFKSRIGVMVVGETREVYDFCLRYCASDGSVTLGSSMEQVRNPYDYPYTAEHLQVNVKPFFDRLNSGAALKRAGLLRPFFYAENLTAEGSGIDFAIDSFVTTRYIRRG